jgi:hypothetical protein
VPKIILFFFVDWHRKYPDVGFFKPVPIANKTSRGRKAGIRDWRRALQI